MIALSINTIEINEDSCRFTSVHLQKHSIPAYADKPVTVISQKLHEK